MKRRIAVSTTIGPTTRTSRSRAAMSIASGRATRAQVPPAALLGVCAGSVVEKTTNARGAVVQAQDVPDDLGLLLSTTFEVGMTRFQILPTLRWACDSCGARSFEYDSFGLRRTTLKAFSLVNEVDTVDIDRSAGNASPRSAFGQYAGLAESGKASRIGSADTAVAVRIELAEAVRLAAIDPPAESFEADVPATLRIGNAADVTRADARRRDAALHGCCVASTAHAVAVLGTLGLVGL